MLEAMQEKQVTIGGVEHKLPNPFITIATQNPIEQEGTYLLPEAQLDRFLLKEKLDYPNKLEEIEILNRKDDCVFEVLEEIISLEDIIFLQKVSKNIYIDDSIKKYIVDIVNITRNTNLDFSKYINLGASPRASIAFMECAKAKALLNGRDYVLPEDIKKLAYSVLRHRISLKFTAQIDDISIETIIDKVIEMVETP